MNRILIFLIVLPLAVCCQQQKTFTWQNPISNGIDTNGLRDCQVFRDGDSWYLTGTSYPHWEREEKNGNFNPGVVLYQSDDLLHWKKVKTIVPAGDSTKWYYRRFWAPEVQKINGRYYCTFNCSNPQAGYPGQHIGYAVAENLVGPYTIVTEAQPLASGNDLTFFEDEDKKVYAFWNRGREFGIGFAQINLITGKFISEPTSAIKPASVSFDISAKGDTVKVPGYDGRPVNKVKSYSAWDAIGIEGAYVIKRNSKYYLFYSSWTRGYEIGYATADKVTGPWMKYAGNPIYGAQSETTAAKNGLPFTADKNNPFNQVGHNQIFTGPDGRLWLSCHGILKSAAASSPKPFLVIDPIEFDAAGNVKAHGPTYTPQQVTLKTLQQ